MKRISLFILLALSAFAADNKVYLDQTGNNSTITITQTGAGNSVGTQAVNAKITGNSNALTISQIGNTNTMFNSFARA